MPTHFQLVPLLLDALLRLFSYPQVWLAAVAVVAALAHRWLQLWWTRRKQAALERRARNWPTVTATIEVPTVTGGYVTGKGLIFATLTYFYRNPDLQVGDYKRPFRTKATAKAWARQFKNRTVLVHVNPAEPADSVLFESEIAGVDLPVSAMQAMAEASAEAAAESLAAADAIHALTPGMRLLCGSSEIVSLAGFAISAVLFAVSFTSHGNIQLRVYYWICGAMLTVTILNTVTIYIDLQRSESGRQLLRTYRRWCPAWMRWSLTLTGVFFGILHPLFGILGDVLRPYMHSMAKRLEPHVPYLLGCWVFFVLAAFLAAIMGSQEDPRAIIETAQVRG